MFNVAQRVEYKGKGKGRETGMGKGKVKGKYMNKTHQYRFGNMGIHN